MNKLLSFIFAIFLLFTMGCESEDMPIIGGDIVGPGDLVGCEAAYMYDWDSVEFESTLDQDEDIWIAFDLSETTLFSVFIDQAGFQCSIFQGCDGAWGAGSPLFQFESVGNGVEVGIVTEGEYWLNILNTRNRADFTFSIDLDEIVYGCLQINALNYNPDANVGDGSCVFNDCNTEWYVSNYGEMILDCDGNCSPISWIGDDYCDDGAYGIYNENYEVIPVNLMCDALQWDLGDCDEIIGECPPGQVYDCNENCGPDTWVGDGFCDDGSFTFNGNQIFFNCEEFNNDGGDCDGSFNRQQNQQPKFPNGRIQLGQ